MPGTWISQGDLDSKDEKWLVTVYRPCQHELAQGHLPSFLRMLSHPHTVIPAGLRTQDRAADECRRKWGPSRPEWWGRGRKEESPSGLLRSASHQPRAQAPPRRLHGRITAVPRHDEQTSLGHGGGRVAYLLHQGYQSPTLSVEPQVTHIHIGILIPSTLLN